MHLQPEDLATLTAALDDSDRVAQMTKEGAQAIAEVQAESRRVFGNLFHPTAIDHEKIEARKKKRIDAANKRLDDNALVRAKLIQMRRRHEEQLAAACKVAS